MQPEAEPNNQNFGYRQEGDTPPTSEEQTADPVGIPAPHGVEPINWTASEYIAHHKDATWYGSAIGISALLCVVVYLITKDLISVVSIAVVALLFLVLSGNKPRQRAYSVSGEGISIADRFYPYSDFKSFSLSQENAIGSISFMPLKRLMPEISIYYDPQDEQRIVDVLINRLPNDQRPAGSGFDEFMKRLHF
jgi:hypothetical protein